MTIYQRYRLEHKLTQKEMAEKLGITKGAYTNYELARNRMPYPVLAKILRGIE